MANVKYYELLIRECYKMSVPKSELDRINLAHYRKYGGKRKSVDAKESNNEKPPGEEIPLFGDSSTTSQGKAEKRKLWYFDQSSQAKIHKESIAVDSSKAERINKYQNTPDQHVKEENKSTTEEQTEYYTLGILPKDIHIEYQAKKILYYQKKIKEFGETESVKQVKSRKMFIFFA